MTLGRTRRVLVALALVGAVTAATVTAQADRHVAADVPEAVPASKKVYMITDSVGLGAQWAMPAAFGPGWQVTIDGDPGEFTETLEHNLVKPRLTRTPWVFGDYAIVAAGYNYPYWDGARFDRSVDTMVQTLTSAGVKHIFWVTLREIKPQYVSPGAWRQIQPYYWYFPTVNDHLEAALARHPNLSLIDWEAVSNQSGVTYDAIHLNNPGAALYSAISRQAVIDATTAVRARSVTRIAVPQPAGVEAVALNLTSVAPRTSGFLTAFDCDQPMPLVSNHNYGRAQVVAHSAIVPVSSSGEVCVYSLETTNFVADITGRFGIDSAITSTASTRLVDTRELGPRQPAGVPLVVDLDAAPGSSVALSVTAVDAVAPGWVRAAPCDSTSTTSTVNVSNAAAVPNVAVVEPGADGTVCVTASMTSHLIVDRFVTFGPESGFDLPAPTRVLDTRLPEGSARLPAGGVVTLDAATLGIEPDTDGVLLNLTAVAAAGAGFLAAYPCASGVPATSNLNYVPGDPVANFVIVEPDAAGTVCVYSLAATHVVIDLLGTVDAGFTGGTPQRLLDTRTSNLPADWP